MCSDSTYTHTCASTQLRVCARKGMFACQIICMHAHACTHTHTHVLLHGVVAWRHPEKEMVDAKMFTHGHLRSCGARTQDVCVRFSRGYKSTEARVCAHTHVGLREVVLCHPAMRRRLHRGAHVCQCSSMFAHADGPKFAVTCIISDLRVLSSKQGISVAAFGQVSETCAAALSTSMSSIDLSMHKTESKRDCGCEAVEAWKHVCSYRRSQHVCVRTTSTHAHTNMYVGASRHAHVCERTHVLRGVALCHLSFVHVIPVQLVSGQGCRRQYTGILASEHKAFRR